MAQRQRNEWQHPDPNVGIVKSISPNEENVLAVLAAHPDGLYNLTVLEKINKTNSAHGRPETSAGTFYPTVKQLENDGLIEGFWGSEAAPGVRRRYLKINGVGLKALNANRCYRQSLMEEQASSSSGQTIPGSSVSILDSALV